MALPHPSGPASTIGLRSPAAPYKGALPNLFFWEIMADSLTTANLNVRFAGWTPCGTFLIDFAAPLDR